jgi:hypothetical protein
MRSYLRKLFGRSDDNGEVARVAYDDLSAIRCVKEPNPWRIECAEFHRADGALIWEERRDAGA